MFDYAFPTLQIWHEGARTPEVPELFLSFPPGLLSALCNPLYYGLLLLAGFVFLFPSPVVNFYPLCSLSVDYAVVNLGLL